MKADIVIAGGGLGGVAAALAALRNGLRVIMTEETDWIGGQLSQQGVPPDEHQWIETHGAPASYRTYRNKVRNYYKQYYPLTDTAKNRPNLNPGDGAVSRLCHEPRVAVLVLTEMLSPYLISGQMKLLLEHKVVSAKTIRHNVKNVTIIDLKTKTKEEIKADFFVDATELGDLLPMTPLVGASKPATIRKHVVLPQPDGPTIATNSLSATVKLVSPTARNSLPP